MVQFKYVNQESYNKMGRYLDPKADVVFKKIFGEHPHLLKSFLNAVLPLPEDRVITELHYLNPQTTPAIPILKHTIADVRCRDNQGREFIVEMQIEWTDSFKQRLLFESGQALIKQLNKGENYHLLQPVYGLGIIATNFDPTPHWYHHYQLVNVDKTPRQIIEHLQLVFIELQKFPIQSPTHKQLRMLWLRFLREINEKTKQVADDLLDVPEIKQAVELTEEAAYNENELLAYEQYWNAISTEKTLMTGRFMEGLIAGREEGLIAGREAGLIAGREAGLAAGLEAGLIAGREAGHNEGCLSGKLVAAQEIAKTLLSQQLLSLEKIAEVTQLPLTEIVSLRNSLKL